MARYAVVLFDVGDTLVGPRESYGAVYGRVLGEMGIAIAPDRIDRGIRETSAEMARTIPPGRDRYSYFGGESAYWSRFFDEVFRWTTGRPADPDFARRSLKRLGDAFGRKTAWRVYDDVVPVLEELRRLGLRLGVVSNWDSRLPRLLDMLDLSRHFASVGVSHLEGVEKPDPELFRRVLSRLGARPGEALHVGNVVETDLAGARAAGVDGLLVSREVPPRREAMPDLRELPRIVREGPARSSRVSRRPEL